MPIRVSAVSHKFCIICRSNLDGKHATAISEFIRLTLLVECTVYLKPGERCCKNHLRDNELKSESLIMLKKNYSLITSTMSDVLMDIINELILQVEHPESEIILQKKVSISFDDRFQYSNDDYFTLIGTYKSDFDNICEQIKMQDTSNRSVSMAIGCLLTKLRIELSNDALWTLFHLMAKELLGVLLRVLVGHLSKTLSLYI